MLYQFEAKFNFGDDVEDIFTGRRGKITAVTWLYDGGIAYRIESHFDVHETYETRLKLVEKKISEE